MAFLNKHFLRLTLFIFSHFISFVLSMFICLKSDRWYQCNGICFLIAERRTMKEYFTFAIFNEISFSFFYENFAMFHLINLEIPWHRILDFLEYISKQNKTNNKLYVGNSFVNKSEVEMKSDKKVRQNKWKRPI